MGIKWFLKNEEYKKYKEHQHEYEDGDDAGYFIGTVRIGELCYDIFNWGNHLLFELYVGGIDTGYGYSDKKEYYNYPYDYCDVGSFRWDDNIDATNIESFKKKVSKYIKEFISITKEYTTDIGKIRVDLVDKSNQKLKLW